MSNPILLAPGPVQLHPEVERLLGLAMIHHRTPEFDQILSSVLTQLKKVFQTTQPVFALSCTGSGGMEALLVNVLNPGDEVLAIVSGKFGERWADMAEAFGAQVHRLHVDWGSAVQLEDVKKKFIQYPRIKIVLCQACETSTGTAQPIQELSQFISQTSALFLVDAITALGAYYLPMDEWKIDGLVGGSQKAFMLPTGMAFLSFSEKAWSHVKKNTHHKFYFNIENELKANLKGETLFSSNVTILRALNYVLTQIIGDHLPQLFKTIENRALYTRKIAELLNLKLYSKSPSLSVTALELPSSIDGVQFRNELEKKFRITVMGGQDQAKGKIIRIGHMGYITEDDLHETTMRLAQLLNENGQGLELNIIEKTSIKLLKEIFSCQ